MTDRAVFPLLLGFGVAYLLWGVMELRSGKARMNWPGRVFSYEEDTFLYSILVAVKLLVLPLAVVFWLLLHGLRA